MSRPVGTFSVMAPTSIDLSVKSEKVATDVVGENVHWFVLIDLSLSLPQIDGAVEDAIQKSGGDYMTDVEITYNAFTVLGLYYRLWFEVKGDVWKVKEPISPQKNEHL